MIARASVAILFLSALAGCGDGEFVPVAEPGTLRETDAGPVIGYVSDNGGHAWRGIPFAASTAGDNRWRAPQPPARWREPRRALESAPRCVQLTNAFDADEGFEPGELIGSEDCLALDIYAPAAAAAAGLPVMVWIHGGANVWGRASVYDGSHLAKNEQVIVVAVQHRLGPLGYFSHPWLRETAASGAGRSANFATLDLIAALAWVEANIAEFGGDPDNVTIFGESAGGHNVVALLASPLAKGLFRQAIVQSGLVDSVPVAEAEGTATNASAEIVERLGVTAAPALRSVPLDRLYAAYDAGEGFLELPVIIEDGIALPAMPLLEAFRSADTFNAVPTITGANRDETKLFFALDDRLTRRWFGLILGPRDGRYYDVIAEYTSRLWRIRAVDELALAMRSAGHEAVYAYRFDWDDGGRFLFADFSELFGAAHGLEIPFVFNRFDMFGRVDSVLYRDATETDRQRLSRAMGAYWASLARSGRPTADAGPEWPPYGRDGRVLHLDSGPDSGPEVVSGVDSVEKLIADLAGDRRVSDTERCAIVAELGVWLLPDDWQDRVVRETGCTGVAPVMRHGRLQPSGGGPDAAG
ncbi:MAG: carboxylesterase family protein [Pseudomonadota bacterium]